MEAKVEGLDRLFEFTRSAGGETTETGILQCLVDAARDMTEGRLAMAGHDFSGVPGEGIFRLNASSIAYELQRGVPDPRCLVLDRAYPELLGRHMTLRLADRELRAHPAWPLLVNGKNPPLRGLIAAQVIGIGGAPSGMLLVSDCRTGEFAPEDEVAVAHLSALASAYLHNLNERALAQSREEEVVARTKRLASRLHQRSERLARLEERHRLAQELHDSVSQSLYAISLSAAAANNLIKRDPQRASTMLDFVLTQARAAVTEMRSLVYELRSNALATEGLHVAFTRLAEALEARWDLRVDLDITCEPAISLEAKETLYRIGQEALRNTARHGRATHARLRVVCEDGVAILEETDDGVGFDPHASSAGHAGLDLMRSQAARLDGACEVNSLPGGGTRVRATIPVRPHRLH